MTIDPNDLADTAKVTFDDEFNSLSLWNNTSGTWATNWWYNGTGSNGGTLNDEQEWYIDATYAPTASIKPWTVSNGILSLTAAVAPTAIRPYINNYAYTSGEINTYHSFSQTYGYFEMRAKLPAGQGFWPAFWLVPEDGSWPPEIDVMEVLGKDPTTLYVGLHYGSSHRMTSVGGPVTVADMSQAFHDYAVDWEPDYTTFYFDGQAVFRTATPATMNKPMYMIADLALGGSWGGPVDSTTPLPSSMQIDYIRAYQSAGPTPANLFTLPTSAAWTDTVTAVNRRGAMTGTAAADLLDGHGAATSMAGLAGDDTYVVYHAADLISEKPRGGIDTVLSHAASYTLPANVENLTLAGSTPQVGLGNNAGNLMISNDAGSSLNGGGGNDILRAGHGADTLTGGAGNDIFEFDAVPILAGHVTDFTPGTDVLDLRQLFSSIGYHGSDPVADGHLSFVADGLGGTQVWFDPDGSGGAQGPALITTLDHVAPGSLHMQTDWAFA